jgi:RHS repeat-associated protein
MLALATSQHLIIIDPARMLQPAGAEGMLAPAIVSIVANAGSGNRSVLQNGYGVSAVSLGARNNVVVTAPRLRFVHFPASASIIQPRELANNLSGLDAAFEKMRAPESLQLARVKTEAGAVSSLNPPTAVAHYHVLMEAPGEVGPDILLSIESLNEAGKALPNMGPLFPPVRAMTEFAMNGIGQKPVVNYDAPVGTLKAFRLSSDPSSRYFNMYLSRPFALISEKIKAADLATLKQNVDREILWSGALLRAAIDPQDSVNSVVGEFASTIENRIMKPGVTALALTLPGHYLFGPNPPPVGGEISIPATFGTVNAANGEFRHSTTDIELPSPRMHIVFNRSYAAQDLYAGPFGRGWDFSYGQKLIEYRPQTFPEGSKNALVIRAVEAMNTTVEAGDVIFQTGESRLILFKKTSSPPASLTNDPLLKDLHWFDGGNVNATYYLPGPNEAGVFDVLCRFPGGEFCRVTPEGMQYWYASSGRLERVLDKYPENRHLLRYNSNGELVKIIDESVSAERFLQIGYYRAAGDPLFDSSLDLTTDKTRLFGLIARLKDYTATPEREVLFEYDGNTGTLERRLGMKASGANGGFGERPVTTYQWDTGRTHIRGVVAGNSSGSGGGANAGTPLFSTTTQVNSEAQGVVTSGSGAGGPVQLSVPTSPDQNSAKAVAQIQSKSTAPDGGKTDFEFDALGYPKTMNMSGATGPNAKYETHYDTRGRVSSVVYPEGNSITYNYFASPQTFRSQPNIQNIVVTPGSRGGDVLTCSYDGGYDLKYNLPKGTFKDFNEKTISYVLTTDLRDTEQVRYGTAGTHETKFNDHGQLKSEQTPEGVVISHVYDDSGTRFLKETRRGGLLTSYDYSGSGGFSKAGDLGVPTKITPPRGATTATDLQYDAFLRVIHVQRAGRSENRGYDENGNLISVKRSLGGGEDYEETRVYDQISFLKEVKVKGVEVNGQAQELSTKFAPDAGYRVKQVTYPDNKVRSFQYNHLGHVTRMSMGAAADVDDYHETYGRDRHGNLTSVSPRDELIRTITYDGHDRVIEERNKTGRDDEVLTATHHGAGQRRLTKLVKGTEIVLETEVTDLDELGRPKTEEIRGGQASGTRTFSYSPQGGGGLLTTISGPRDVVKITTDSLGRVKKMENGLASSTYTLDGNDNVEKVDSVESGVTYTRSATFNPLDYQLTESDPIGQRFGYTPRLDGLPTETRDGRQKITKSAYTVLGELKKLNRLENVEFSYEFDAERLPRKVADAEGKGNTISYDDQLRMTGVTYRSGDGIGMSAFDKRNQPQTISLPGGGSIDRQNGYDLQGRIIKESSAFDGNFYKVENTVYDAMGRIRSIKYGSSAQHSASFEYDKFGPLTKATWKYQPGGEFTVSAQIDSDGSRKQVTYPSTIVVDESREGSGRLTEVKTGGVSLWKTSAFKGADLPGETTYGGVIREVNDYDARKRLIRRRYEKLGNSALLAEMRFKYDLADNLLARQHLERNGRADVFGYDEINRVTRAELGARPTVSGAVRVNVAGVSGGESLDPGLFARTYSYDTDGLDLLLGGGIPANPAGLPEQAAGTASVSGPIVPGFARTLDNPDGYLHLRELDGAARGGTDGLGNVQGTTVLVRPANVNDVVRRKTTDMSYNALNQLVHIALDDGTTIDYEYEPGGLMQHRTVKQSGATVSERLFVWDDARLVEEYERAGGANRLIGRYYYSHGDWPVAADLEDGTGQLQRRFYLCDNVYSVIAVADDSGAVIERIGYDTWGQPAIEIGDTNAPRVAHVTVETSGSFLFQFSEMVFPAVPPGGGTGLVTGAGAIPSLFALTSGGQSVPGTLEYVEDAPNAPFGSVVRFTPGQPLNGRVDVVIQPNQLFDVWGHGNMSENFSFPGTGPGIVFNGAVTDTAPERRARSAIGNPFLFHGQWFDYDAGLVYMRARFYDPYTGSFLQRDPMQYGDSVNLYSAFLSNPLVGRDPTGTTALSTIVSQATGATARGLTKAEVRLAIQSALKGRIGLEAAEEIMVQLGKKQENVKRALDILNIMRKNPALELIGTGSGSIIFGVKGTDKAVKTFFRESAQRGSMHGAITQYDDLVRGFKLYKEVGWMKYYGSTRNGRAMLRVPGGSIPIDVGRRPMHVMGWQKQLLDIDSVHGLPDELQKKLDSELSVAAKYFEDISGDKRGDFQGGLVRLANDRYAVRINDPERLSETAFQRGLQKLKEKRDAGEYFMKGTPFDPGFEP